MLDFDKVRALLEAMNREGVCYVVFGALALAAHGLVRATEDVDFFIEPTAENVGRLKRALRSIWNDPNIDEISSEDLCGEYPAVAYYPPDEEFGMDFLTRLDEAHSYATLDVQDGSLEGVPIRVVTPRQLYEMKRDTVRWKDKNDAEAVRRKFALEE